MKTLFPKLMIAAVILVAPVLVTCGFTATLSDALLPDIEKGTVIIKDHRSGKMRSRVTYSLRRKTNDGRALYHFTQKGEGDYGRFQDALWTVKAQWEEQGGLLRILDSICTVRDRDHNTLAVFKKEFDYNRKSASFIHLGAEDNVLRSETFPIKGPITDDTAMVFFLRPFAANLNDENLRNFYLLSNEPRLYHVNIRVIQEETLETPLGALKAVKLQLFADLGPLTELALRIVPPTFVWYQKDDPSVWLRYEGLETGRASAHVESYLVETNKNPD